MPRWVRVYLIPGAIFQSIMVGGGYGTGRELVEYFVRFGVGGAFSGMLLAMLLFSIIMAFTFEFARVFQTFDYRSFLRQLIGPIWPLFEISYLLGVLLVLAVVASATAAIVESALGVPGLAGGGLMLLAIVALVFFGRSVITLFFTFWSLVLYVVFAIYLIALLSTHTDEVVKGFEAADIHQGWILAAFKYVGYNIGAGIIALFAVRDIRSRTEAIGSGVMAGIIAMLPAFMFATGFAAGYPDVIDEAVPNYFMLDKLGIPWITGLFLIVLVGTFIETGAGMIQGIIERVDGWMMERRGEPASRWIHGLVALTAVILSTGMATFGVITLVAKGYGTLAWFQIIFYLTPLLTIGSWQLWRNARRPASLPGA
ncbi:MAG: hypothetical protein QMC26_13115 [Pseudomonadales bacterium]|jgi:uncharacterized membrane protein YkvI|tara:strand:+ start:1698 stop:2807 length:1110 start_codon:yes stop_codon:yes gene_type:complete